MKEGQIEVYIGVMPEEVSPLIKGSLEMGDEGSILIITRTDIKEAKELLEQSLNLYAGLEETSDIAVTTDSTLKVVSNEKSITRKLACGIKNEAATIKFKKEFILGFKSKMEKKSCLKNNKIKNNKNYLDIGGMFFGACGPWKARSIENRRFVAKKHTPYIQGSL